MRYLIIAICLMLVVVTLAFADSLSFVKPIPAATQSTWGSNQQLELQGAAITEIRTKMQNWATFSGYSAGTTR